MWRLFRNILCFLVIALTSSCTSETEIEESVIVHDSNHFERIVKALHKEKIKFRLGDGLVIWHPISERNQVKQILSEQAAILPAEYVIRNSAAYEKFLSRLESHNIKYSTGTSEEGAYLISVPREKQELSSKFFHEVLGLY